MSFARPWKNVCLAILLLSAGFDQAVGQTRQYAYDLVVYGTTPSGIVAAVEGARHGLRVALVGAEHHEGGMVAGGLSRTDVGDATAIGGLPLEFFQRVGRRYGKPVAWNFEPHAASFVFDQMLREAHVDLYLDSPILEKGGVEKQGASIRALNTGGGQRFQGKVFVDASYEGTLMGAAAVTYTWGREPRSRYGESLAGYLGMHYPDTNYQNFNAPVSAYAADGSLLPGVQPQPPLAPGDGDDRVQAYAFRLCITQRAGNKLPFPKPAHYDPADYALLARQIQTLARTSAWPLSLRSLATLGPLPNGKYDVNNFLGVSVDDIGASRGYPGANAAGRAAIWQAHYEYLAGFFYFLANDPGVPASLQADVRSYGLAKDEFADNGGWPWQLYVRESRRMLGDYVMTQRDIQTQVAKADAIGLGSYPIDSHHVQRVVTADGTVRNEGNLDQGLLQSYQMPYRMLLPKPGQADNLMVTVGFSASHVAYGSLRTEPQYMVAGQAAGVAAALAVHQGIADLHAIPVDRLKAQLRAEHAALDL